MLATAKVQIVHYIYVRYILKPRLFADVPPSRSQDEQLRVAPPLTGKMSTRGSYQYGTQCLPFRGLPHSDALVDAQLIHTNSNSPDPDVSRGSLPQSREPL